MPGMKWRPYGNGWKLMLRQGRRRCAAYVYPERYGWMVLMTETQDEAGPYGDLDLARQSAEKRMEERRHAGNGSAGAGTVIGGDWPQ